MKVEVIDIEGKPTGRSVSLPNAIFKAKPNDHAIYLAVKQYNANQRQGTHKSKERADIKGSTRKIKRQKGTGTARAGSIKNPLFRGGGRVFGPRPRDYEIKLNKKVKLLARTSALSQKMQQGGIMVIEDFTFDSPKTQALQDLLNKIIDKPKKCLLVTSEHDKNVYLSSRNLPNTSVLTAGMINTYAILNCNHLILTENSIGAITSSLSNK